MALINCDTVINDILKWKITIDKHTIPKVVYDSFWKDFEYRFCWSTNALEGNTLSLDETISVLEYDEVRSGHTYSEYLEAKNMHSAIREMLFPIREQNIDESWIKKANGYILGREGEYRSGEVYIGSVTEAVYYPPAAEQVPALMKDYVGKINIDEASIEGYFKQLAKLHLQFERIHPFIDGNGRVGRMIMNQQLINNGYLPISIDPIGKYRQSFRRYDNHRDFSLMEYVLCKSELKSLQRLDAAYQKYQKDRGCQVKHEREESINY